MTRQRIQILQLVAPFLAIIQLSATIHLRGAEVATAEMASSPPRPPEPAVRVPKTSMGITQLSNEKLDWFLDAKFGMFIHWGLYSGVGRGEWAVSYTHLTLPTNREV